MLQTRRQFLRKTAYYGLGAATFQSLVETFRVTNALAQPLPGYRALVCIFMGGGNDSNNMVVPISSNAPNVNYAAYTAERGVQGGAAPGLGLPQTGPAALLPISVPGFAGGTATFGLHPSFASATYGGLQQFYNAGRLAIVANAGPLVFPMSQAQYINGSVQKPFQLFSHSDQVQQWQTARADNTSQTGWGGRLADAINHGTGAFPEITSIAGSAVYTIGVNSRPLAIGPAPTALNSVLVLNGFGTAADEVARREAFNTLRTVDSDNKLVQVSQDITQQALDVAQALSVNPTISTTFPNTGLGNQLLQVAKVIKANLTQPILNLSRQIFFVSFGGFDTHSNQLNGQGGLVGGALNRGLLGQLNDAMAAFYNWTVAAESDTQIPAAARAGLSGKITQFTHSDFNRTFNPAGTGGAVGSDHAWGSHQFILGGSVFGGLYGVPLPGGNGTVFPSLNKNGPYDVQTSGGRGRWIPSTSVEQVANTLAAWYGLAPADQAAVFPLLSRFSPANLGFMA